METGYCNSAQGIDYAAMRDRAAELRSAAMSAFESALFARCARWVERLRLATAQLHAHAATH